MNKRAPVKPKGKETRCWAWKKGHKGEGLQAESRQDIQAAETHRCHRIAQPDTGRCRWHGGTSKAGKGHHRYKHGFYSCAHQSILARAADAYEAVGLEFRIRSLNRGLGHHCVAPEF